MGEMESAAALYSKAIYKAPLRISSTNASLCPHLFVHLFFEPEGGKFDDVDDQPTQGAMAIDVLRRFLLCFYPAAAAAVKPSHSGANSTSATTPKKRLSTSLRDDIAEEKKKNGESHHNQDQDSVSSSTDSAGSFATAASAAPSRPSKSMVIGTIFGNRRGHVWFCVQHDRLSIKPILLLELSIFTNQLVQEMRFGLVRIALECDRSELEFCPLRSVPLWTMFCNGRKLGFAAKRKASERVRLILKTMQCVSVGAGVIPSGFGSDSGSEELMYMRANYEHVVGSADSESFHLINPDESPGQELSVFLLRSRNVVPH
ncbi:protein MIZU-KUSSEI 1 [Senna tora]|uniref:Protein MIZU-KUSSEI 1 n=1 Tax=Senna tora TaxID=362788 RepID=A0A835CMC9_9FABA|nr:protein MIZU-KUSSEI 1 [Senna tora]